jgi:hypothetical protein
MRAKLLEEFMNVWFLKVALDQITSKDGSRATNAVDLGTPKNVAPITVTRYDEYQYHAVDSACMPDAAAHEHP